MMPEVLGKGKAVALPITINLTKDMTIDNGISHLEGEEEALQHAITASRTYASAIIKPAASPSNYTCCHPGSLHFTGSFSTQGS
jgi:hypothetical protein